MVETGKLKIFNDPIYGFIGIPSSFIFQLIAEPHFQRLRRISQMGLSYLVYPGAHHTRFHHALGSMHLMVKTIAVLKQKKVPISPEEEEGLLVAILLHDIGHGPFSHAMEHSIVEGIQHETISLHFMELLNRKYEGRLDVAIEIFKGEHPKMFLNQLVSGQLDMDRLDYLKRDSFYTGVPEGNINSDRLITMLNVVDGRLVVAEKGIYSVEKFLFARRFMYWQVYLHKTGIVAEQLLIKTLQRAKSLLRQGVAVEASKPLLFFMKDTINKANFDDDTLLRFALLDDIDVLSAIKSWQNHPDTVLAKLCSMILNRDFLHIKLKNKPIRKERIEEYKQKAQERFQLTPEETSYFVFTGEIHNQAYRSDKQNINILYTNGKITDVAKASDQLNLKALSKTVVKYYICYPKDAV